MTPEQLAHDLAIVYLNNRYGPEVSGSFSVTDYGEHVSGEGSVDTERLAAVDDVRIERVATGERRFGIFAKTEPVERGFEVDPTFLAIIEDYFRARNRFYELLMKHYPPSPTA